MKIGYVRLSMNIELDYNQASIGNAEGRISLIKSIIDAGHDIYLLSQTSLHDEHVMQGTMNDNGKISTKWIRSNKIHYYPMSYPKANLDMLLVENGPDNITFRDRYGHTFIERFRAVMRRYSGPVIIMNVHPDAPFPLHKLAFSRVQFDDKRNVYRKGKSHPDHGWGSYYEICKDKKLLLLVQAHEPEKYCKMKDGKRQQFFRHNIPIDRLPIVFDKYLVPSPLQPVRYKIAYMGYPRSREDEFRKYFTKLSIPVHTWGKWDAKNAKTRAFRTEMELEGIKIYGFVKGQVNITDILSRSLMTVSLVPRRLQECGYLTHRNLETIHAGCINFACKVPGITDYLNPLFIIKNRERFEQLVQMLSNINESKRKEINKEQLAKIKKYNGFYMLDYLVNHMKYAEELLEHGRD